MKRCPCGCKSEPDKLFPDLLGRMIVQCHDCSFCANQVDWQRRLDNSDLLAAQSEVTRLRGLFEQILAHPEDMAYDARFWRNFAREALKDPS